MSCVVSEIFRHSEKKAVCGDEINEVFYNTSTQTLKTFGDNDKFYVLGECSSTLQGCVRTRIELSVSEAKRLKKQLEEFILNNS